MGRCVSLAMDLLLVPCMFVLLPIINSSQSACPVRCACDTQRHLVNCQNAGLRHIPWDLPVPMELAHLDLSHNEISEINAQIVYSNLKFLDLSSNNIIRIHENFLRDLPNLEVLYLRDNNLGALEENVFDGMTELRNLDISKNELTSIQVPLFDGLMNLEELNLAGNALDNISSVAFRDIDTLHHLNLEDNRITSISQDTFSGLQSLKTLKLGYNKLTVLPSGAFSELQMLRELDIESNHIRFIADDTFNTAKSSHISQVENLDLRNNLLDMVPSRAISTLDNLEILDLSQNPLSEITSGAFQGLRQVRTIHINTMPRLTVVNSGAFQNLGNLQELEMHSNHKLSTLSKDAFQVVPQLRKVDLHANALQTLGADVLEWTDLKLLDLRYNPWHCDCRLSWLPAVLTHQANNETLYITHEVRCHTPKDFTGKLIATFQKELFDSTCSDGELVTIAMKPEKFQDHIMIAIMCTVGGVLVVVIVILMCKYGKSYQTAYAPAMDQYVSRHPEKCSKAADVECQRIPVIEGDMSMARSLRSSLSSNAGIGVHKDGRRLHRVRFAEADAD